MSFLPFPNPTKSSYHALAAQAVASGDEAAEEGDTVEGQWQLRQKMVLAVQPGSSAWISC